MGVTDHIRTVNGRLDQDEAVRDAYRVYPNRQVLVEQAVGGSPLD